MRVYPEIESWNEFYPSEIFITLDEGEVPVDAFPVFKIANIGTTIYLGVSANETYINKKIGDIEDLPDIRTSMILVGYYIDSRSA